MGFYAQTEFYPSSEFKSKSGSIQAYSKKKWNKRACLYVECRIKACKNTFTGMLHSVNILIANYIINFTEIGWYVGIAEQIVCLLYIIVLSDSKRRKQRSLYAVLHLSEIMWTCILLSVDLGMEQVSNSTKIKQYQCSLICCIYFITSCKSKVRIL